MYTSSRWSPATGAFRIFLECLFGWRRDASSLVVTVGAIGAWLTHPLGVPKNVQCGTWGCVWDQAEGNMLEMWESPQPCLWKESPAQVLGGFPLPGWAGNNWGDAGTHRGDLAVTPGHCRAASAGRSTFLHTCFWVKTVMWGKWWHHCLLPQVPFGECWPGRAPEEMSWSSPIPQDICPHPKSGQAPAEMQNLNTNPRPMRYLPP